MAVKRQGTPMIRRRWRWLLIGFIGLVALGGVGLVGFWRGWHVEPLLPEQLSDRLRPHDRIVVPEGEGPFPTVILFHGCGGLKDAMPRWQAFFRELGYASVAVDSLAPRGWDNRRDSQPVCMGLRLTGRQRAGDVLVSFEDVKRMPFADPERIVLAGWSHGGWAIMDMLALDPPRDLPIGLRTAYPSTIRRGLEGLEAVMLVYPYCGFGNLARNRGWPSEVPTLMLLAGEDSIVPTGECLGTAGRLAADGRPITVHVFAGIDHGFDEQERGNASWLEFDPETTADAMSRAAAFLATAAP